MSLPLPDHTLKTSCKNCIFSIYEGDTQKDCQFDRINKFKSLDKVIEAYDNEKEFYVINGLCNLSRPLSWNGGVSDKNKALEESSVNYKIYFNCEDLTSEFKNRILQFSQNSYYNTKYSITLYHDLNASQDLKKEIIDIYRASNQKIYITSCRNIDEYLHNACLNSKEAYSINIKNADTFDLDILSKINNKINLDLNKGLVIKNGTVYVISNTIYKIENLENQYNSFSKTFEGLLQKVQNTNLYFEI